MTLQGSKKATILDPDTWRGYGLNLGHSASIADALPRNTSPNKQKQLQNLSRTHTYTQKSEFHITPMWNQTKIVIHIAPILVYIIHFNSLSTLKCLFYGDIRKQCFVFKLNPENSPPLFLIKEDLVSKAWPSPRSALYNWCRVKERTCFSTQGTRIVGYSNIISIPSLQCIQNIQKYHMAGK